MRARLTHTGRGLAIALLVAAGHAVAHRPLGLQTVAAAELFSAAADTSSAGRSSSAADDETTFSGSDFAQATRVHAVWTPRLLQVEGVVGTAVGADPQGRPLILVLAERAGVDVPDEVDGLPVKVLVTGRFFARELSGTAPAARTLPQEQPLPIGMAAAGAAQRSAAGTIACRVVDPQGRRYALSNAHVFLPNAKAETGTEVLHLQSGDEGRVLGRVVRAAAIDPFGDNRVDAALAIIEPGTLGTATPSDGYGTPSSRTVTAAVGQRVEKYGATTGLTAGRVLGVGATVLVGASGGTVRFVDQILVQGHSSGFVKAGDAGALLVLPNDGGAPAPVGLLFAGSLGGSYALANPIDAVLAELGVAIDDGAEGRPERSARLALASRPAFPGAEGYGASASGGRAGRVIEVTNLNDSGPGSLREAVQASGPRTVVFKVSGTIRVESELLVTNPDITIAGQTAPGDGITLMLEPPRGKSFLAPLGVRTQNVVIRYLRLRRGDRGGTGDSLHIHDGSSHVVVDHCSLTWATDENLDIYSAEGGLIRDITIQNSLIAESLKTGDGSALGALLSGLKETEYWRRLSRIDLHHNVFAHNTHRNPRVITRGTRVINNIIYNWNSRAGSTEQDTVIDWIGNYFIRGPMSSGDNDRLLFHGTTSPDLSVVYPDASIYIVQNIAPSFGFRDPAQDNWPMLKDHHVFVEGKRAEIPLRMRRAEPLAAPQFPVTIVPPDDRWKKSLLSDVGAHRRLNADGTWVAALDPIDSRILADVASGTGPTLEELPASVWQAARGYMPRSTHDGYADWDHDGLPDEWEETRGFDKTDPSDGPVDADNDGWTNLEEFLNGTDPRAAD